MAPLVLFLVALGIRLATFLAFPEPAYPDALYYANVARNVAAGSGLSVDYIWSFVEVGGVLPATGTLPIPANAHWMPLAVLIQVPFLVLLGPGPLASGLPFWLLAAAAAPLTWAIARDAGLGRLQAACAGLLAAAPGLVLPYLAQPDNFAPYMLLGALALWLCGRALRGDRRAFLAGSAVVGLAFLSRNDGVLLAVPFLVVFLAGRRGHAGARRIGWGTAIAGGALCLAIVAPWLARQLLVFGSLSPSAANGRILWIADYAELFSIATPASLSTFLAQGIGPILASRVGGLVAAVGILVAGPLLVVLAPCTAAGAWARRRDPRFLPWAVYTLTLLAFSGLLFAVHVPYGTFLHSVVAGLPHAFVLAIAGIGVLVGAVARRRRRWDAADATRVFTVALTGLALLLAGAGTLRTLDAWRAEQAGRAAIIATLRADPDPGRVMSPDPGAYRYHAARTGIVTPDDPLPVIADALERYGVRHLVIERAHPVPALAPI
ncbi:MAG: glycosyltransferase family 39 protein, partial [Chloroflexota bacterium]